MKDLLNKNSIIQTGKKMVKIKPIEEWVENYVIGTIQGMFKQKRHWLQKGFPMERAIKNAINYGINQLSAGVGSTVTSERAEEMLREIATIANAMADFCSTLKNSK